jgi:hypothetical protein
MITFYRDALAPPELCQLLCQTIPEEYHVPVVFTTRGEQKALGECYDGAARSPYIKINLSVTWGCISWASRIPGAIDAQIWYKLLSLCYHEFGHVATMRQCNRVGRRAYNAGGRDFWWVEELADLWKTRQLLHLLDHDPRLGQPRAIGGYVGVRLAKMVLQCRQHNEWGSGKVMSLKNWRCYKTGGQLGAGDVARCLRLRKGDSYDYAKLRKLSKGIGIDYTDKAGRTHKFYTWGDLVKLSARTASHDHT